MKNKFNIVDVIIAIILIVVVAVCGFVYFKFASKDTVGVDGTTKIQFTVEVSNLSEEAAQSFKNAIGCSATFGPTASGIGTVSDVEVAPYKKWVKNVEDGEVVISEVPDKYTANVTIVSDVVKTELSYTCGSEVVSIGKAMPFNSKGAASEDGFIINLTEVK